MTLAGQAPAGQPTPGPWRLIEIKNARGSVIGWDVVTSDGSYEIASVNNFGEENNEANARLIASARDLIDALSMALDDSEVMAPDGRPMCVSPETLQRIRAALSRATGSQP